MIIFKKFPVLIISCGIILTSVIVFFAKSIFFSNGTFIGGVDVPGYFYWNAEFIKESFLSGSIPLWNPYYYSGHPFLANPSTFVFYPITLVYVFLPLPWAFNIDTIFHIFLAAIGMFFFVKSITYSIEAGIASAIVYSFSGYFVERIFAGHITLIHAAALIPFVFYYVENALKTKNMKDIVLSGIFLGLQILGGDPQISYYTSLFLALYILIRVMSGPEYVFRNDRLKALMYFCLVPLIAFGISAIQILPSLELKSLSERARNTFEFATFLSFSPAQFHLLLIPKPLTGMLSANWEYGCYVGILSLILGGIGLFFSKLKNYTLCLGIMLIIVITLVLGSNTPLYYLYYKLLPMLSTFRVPARCLVIFDFLMAALVGIGIHHLLKCSLTRTQYLISTVGMFVLLGCLLINASEMQIRLNSKEIIEAILILSCSFILLGLYMFVAKVRITVWLLIAVLFVDLYMVYSPFIPRLDASSYLQKQPFEELFEKETGLYRVNIPGGIEHSLYGVPARGMKYHYYGINGNTPIVLKEYFDFIYSMAGLPQPTLFRHTFTNELFRDESAFSSKILGVKYAMVEKSPFYSLEEAKWYMPRAVLVDDAIVLPNIQDHLTHLKDSQFDPTKTILLERDDYHHSQPPLSGMKSSNAKGLVKINSYKPNVIELRSYSESNTYLLLSELYCPGWRAYVDGKKVPVLRADYLLRAIPLSSGEHFIKFAYMPMSFYQGIIITICTLVVVGYFLFTHCFAQKNDRKADAL